MCARQPESAVRVRGAEMNNSGIIYTTLYICFVFEGDRNIWILAQATVSLGYNLHACSEDVHGIFGWLDALK